MADWTDVPLEIAPGLYKETTGKGARGRWIDGSNVRFWKGFPERIGGWATLIAPADASAEPARGAHAFKTLANIQYLAYGTATKLYLVRTGTVSDITPTSSFTAGAEDSSTTYDWGEGGWGDPPWSGVETLYTTTNHALTWTMASWGEDLIANPRGQGIFVWDASVGTGTPASRILTSPPEAAGVFVSDVDRTLVAYGAHNGYRSTFTITIASPGVVTWTAHGHSAGDTFVPTTTGALPTGLTAGATYYIINPTTDTFQLSLTSGGAAINTTGSQSGTHTGTTGTSDPLNIRWCSSEDYTVWRPTDTNTAGDLRCEVGNEIVGAMPARGGHIICTDIAAYFFRYVGGTFVYGLQRIADGPSMVSPHAGVQDAAGNTFWMGPKGFYVYDGTVSTLPCDVHADIFSNINVAQRFKIYCGTIREFNEIIWFYARVGSTEINACVAYNTIERTWWQGDLARTSWVDRSTVIDYPVGWGADGLVYAQETGDNGNGTAIEYSLESANISSENGTYTRGRKLIVDYDRITGTHEVEIDVRGYPQSDATTLGPFNVTDTSTQLSVRARGREVRLRFSGSDDFRLGRWQMRVRPAGGKE